MNKHLLFTILLMISALTIAFIAAFFSVFGLSKLYAGGILILILFTSLEIGKIVTVSYVYRYWNSIIKKLRMYFLFAIVFISLLTSLGIYSFLTNSYQSTHNILEVNKSKIDLIETKKITFVTNIENIQKQIDQKNNRVFLLTKTRQQQENRLDSLYKKNLYTVAKRTETTMDLSNKEVDKLNSEIGELMSKVTINNDSIQKFNLEILELKNSDVEGEIGPLRYLSELTGFDMKNIVNFLTLLIIFVFDPFAISLIIASNHVYSIYLYDKKKKIKNNNLEKYENGVLNNDVIENDMLIDNNVENNNNINNYYENNVNENVNYDESNDVLNYIDMDDNIQNHDIYEDNIYMNNQNYNNLKHNDIKIDNVIPEEIQINSEETMSTDVDKINIKKTNRRIGYRNFLFDEE